MVEFYHQAAPWVAKRVNVTVVQMAELVVSAQPFPDFVGSEAVSPDPLNRIEDTSVFEQARLRLHMIVIPSSEGVDVTRQATRQFRVFTPGTTVESSAFIQVAQAEGIARAAYNPPAGGVVDIVGQFCGVQSSRALRLSLSLTSVRVTGIEDAEFPTALNGLVGTAAALRAGVRLSDGTKLPAEWLSTERGLLIENLMRFEASPAHALTFSSWGVGTLAANSIANAVQVTVSTWDSSHQETFLVDCNLQPAVGDVDLGQVTGAGLQQLAAGQTVDIAVRINVSSTGLGAVELSVQYSTAAARVVGVRPGQDWDQSSPLVARLDDPAGEIHFGGVQRQASTPAEGTTVMEIAVITLQVLSDEDLALTGTVLNLADSAGQTMGDAVPRAKVAGHFVRPETVVFRRGVLGAPMPEALLQRRRRMTCTHGLCYCHDPPRGDVNGDCAVDVLDAFALQAKVQALAGGDAAAITVGDGDFNLDGRVGFADVAALLQVVFRLSYFVTQLTVEPVAVSTRCEFVLSLALVDKDGQAALPTRTAVFFSEEIPAGHSSQDAGPAVDEQKLAAEREAVEGAARERAAMEAEHERLKNELLGAQAADDDIVPEDAAQVMAVPDMIEGATMVTVTPTDFQGGYLGVKVVQQRGHGKLAVKEETVEERTKAPKVGKLNLGTLAAFGGGNLAHTPDQPDKVVVKARTVTKVEKEDGANNAPAIVVTEVDDHGPAAQQVRVGDQLLGINDQAVSQEATAADVQAMLREAAETLQPVRLHVKRQ